MGDDEWARNGSFMKKPSSGWLHDDAALMNGDGVYYPVKVCRRMNELDCARSSCSTGLELEEWLMLVMVSMAVGM